MATCAGCEDELPGDCFGPYCPTCGSDDDASGFDHDPVNRPSHYTRGGIETIDVIEAWALDFHLGNAIKYISRAGHKGDAVEDLRKARWYIERKLKQLGAGEE